MQPRATPQGLTIRRYPALPSPSYAPPISCEPVPTLRHFFLLHLNAAFLLVHSSLILDRLSVNSNALIAFDLGASRGSFKDGALCRVALSSVCAVLKRLLSQGNIQSGRPTLRHVYVIILIVFHPRCWRLSLPDVCVAHTPLHTGTEISIQHTDRVLNVMGCKSSPLSDRLL